MDAWSGYWKTGARRSPATISITLTGATPPRRSLRFWRSYGPTLTSEIDRLPSPVQTVVHLKGHRALCLDVDIHPVAVGHYVVFFIWLQRSTRRASSRHRC